MRKHGYPEPNHRKGRLHVERSGDRLLARQHVIDRRGNLAEAVGLAVEESDDFDLPILLAHQRNVPLRTEGVRIGTIEKSKGHEFTHVFISGLVDGNLPHEGAILDDDISREAARLYVAMTRARDSLVMTYALESGYRPLRFLTPIAHACNVRKWNGYFLQHVRD